MPTSQEERARWVRIARSLVLATMLYNILEAVIALWLGTRHESLALFGFGLDSLIETAAALALLWRLRAETSGADENAIERMEHRVHQFVGITFLALSVYVSIQACWNLWNVTLPETTHLGILLAAASLVLMPLISWGKLKAARELESAALRAEAKETLACSYLSFTLLLGLVANALAGWWWADPVAALCMVPWLVMEGVEGLRGENCC